MEQRDEELWKIARRRARFQSSLVSVVVISMILWAIWWFTGGERHQGRMPWPLWPMLGMGIYLLLQFIRAYRTDHDTLAEKEYEKLKNQK